MTWHSFPYKGEQGQLERCGWFQRCGWQLSVAIPQMSLPCEFPENLSAVTFTQTSNASADINEIN